MTAFGRQNKRSNYYPHRTTSQGRDYRRHMNSSPSNIQAAENFLVRKFEMYVSLICGCWLLIPIVC